MRSYFIQMLSDQPRRVAVLRNTVKNKKTVATLYWAKQYGILDWLGAMPQLKVAEFEQWLANMQQAGLIEMQEQLVWLTETGQVEKDKFRQTHYQPKLSQWYWLARSNQLWPRILLATQAVSEFTYHQNHYVPLNLSPHELNVVRNWFYHHRQTITVEWYQELKQAAQNFKQLDSRLSELLVYSLTGHQTPGWTTTQAANELQVTPDEIMVMQRDLGLGLAWLAISNPQSLLHELLDEYLHPSPLSHSAQITLTMFENGDDLAQISQKRRLKIGTVREHILEVAIFMPEQIELARFFDVKQLTNFVMTYVGDPITWQFKAPHDDPQTPHDKQENEQAFFEFRLFQIMQGVNNG